MGVESVIKVPFNSTASIHTITVSTCIQGFWLTAWLNFKNHDIYVSIYSDKSFALCILQPPCILMTVLGVNFSRCLSYQCINIQNSVILDTGNCDKHVLPADAVCLRCRNLPQTLHLLTRRIVLWWTNSPPVPYVHGSSPSLVPCLDGVSWFWRLRLVCWTPPLENLGTASFYLNTRHRTNTG